MNLDIFAGYYKRITSEKVIGDSDWFCSNLVKLEDTTIMSMASMSFALTSSCEISSTVSLLGRKSNLMSCNSRFSSRMRSTRCMGEPDGSAATADVVESVVVAEPDTAFDEFEPLTVAFVELSELTDKSKRILAYIISAILNV